MLRGLLNASTHRSSSLRHVSLSDDEDSDDNVHDSRYLRDSKGHQQANNSNDQQRRTSSTNNRLNHHRDNMQDESFHSITSRSTLSSTPGNQRIKKDDASRLEGESSHTLTSRTTLSSSDSNDDTLLTSSSGSTSTYNRNDPHHTRFQQKQPQMTKIIDEEDDDTHDSLHQPVSYLKQSIPDLEDILSSFRNKNMKKSKSTSARSSPKNTSPLSLNNNEDDFGSNDDDENDDNSSNASSYNSGFSSSSDDSSSSDESIPDTTQIAAYYNNLERANKSNNNDNKSLMDKNTSNHSTPSLRSSCTGSTGNFDLTDDGGGNCSIISPTTISVNSMDSSIPDTTQIAAFYKDQERRRKDKQRNTHPSPTSSGSTDSFDDVVPDKTKLSAYCSKTTQLSLKRSGINLSPTSATDIGLLDAEAVIGDVSPVTSNGSQSQQGSKQKRHMLSITNHQHRRSSNDSEAKRSEGGVRRKGSFKLNNNKKKGKSQDVEANSTTQHPTTAIRVEDDSASRHSRSRPFRRNRTNSLISPASTTGKSSFGKSWTRKKRIDQLTNVSVSSEKNNSNSSSGTTTKSSVETAMAVKGNDNTSPRNISPLAQELLELSSSPLSSSPTQSTKSSSPADRNKLKESPTRVAERVITPLAQELAELTSGPSKSNRQISSSTATKERQVAPSTTISLTRQTSASNKRVHVIERFDCDTGEIICSEAYDLHKQNQRKTAVPSYGKSALQRPAEIEIDVLNDDPLKLPNSKAGSNNRSTDKSGSDRSPQNGQKSSNTSSDKEIIVNDIANLTNVIENMVLLYAKSDVEGIRRLLGESLESSVSSLSTQSTYSADDVDFNQSYRDCDYDDVSNDKCGSDKQEAKHLRTVSKLLKEKQDGYSDQKTKLSKSNHNYTVPVSIRGINTHYSISILLIEPVNKVFEIVMVDVTRSTTLKETIHSACMAAVDPTLAKQSYISLCNDVKILSNLSSPISKLIQPPVPICTDNITPTTTSDVYEKQKRDDHIMRKEMERQLLVAVPVMSSFKECQMIRKILWKNPKLQLWWSSYHMTHYNTDTVLPWSSIPIPSS